MEDELAAKLSGLFRSHYDEVLTYCARRIGRDEAEDAASEVFAVAARRVSEIDWATARPWLYGVARGVLANWHRSQRRGRRLVEKARGRAEIPYNSPDEVVVRSSETEDAIRTLRELRPNDREILMLVAWEGLTTPELASAIGISVVAAEKRLERARVRFARAVARASSRVSVKKIGLVGRGSR